MAKPRSERNLTAGERELFEEARAGGQLDLRGRSVPGPVLCKIVSGLAAEVLQPPADLLIVGGTITGGLKLQGQNVEVPITFERCEIGADGDQSAIDLSESSCAGVTLRSCKIGGSLVANRAQIASGFVVEHCSIQGPVILDEAHVSRSVSLDHVVIECGSLSLSAQDLVADNGFSLTNAILKGTAHFDRMRVGREFKCDQVEIDGGELSLVAEDILVDGNFDIHRSKLIGQVTAANCEVSGRMSFSGSRLYGSDYSLLTDRACVQGVCDFSNAMIIGAVRLPGARIGQDLNFSGASLKVDDGVAVFGRDIVVGRDILLTSGFASVGGVFLDRAKISGTLDLTESQIRSAQVCGKGQRFDVGLNGRLVQTANRTGAANNIVTPERNGAMLALSIADAQVHRVQMPHLAEHRPKGVVNFSRARVAIFHDYAAAWPPPYDERDEDEGDGDIDCHVLDGLRYEYLSNPSGARDGKSFDAKPGEVAQQRVLWLAGQPIKEIQKSFTPQPWRFLARRLADQGLDRDSREVLIAKNRFRAASETSSIGQRIQSLLFDVFANYGFAPWRTVLWMGIFVLAFAVLWGWAATSCGEKGCRDQSVFVMKQHAAYAGQGSNRAYPDFHALGFSLDVFIPFANFGFADHWRPNLAWRPIGSVPVPKPLRTLVRSGPEADRGSVGDARALRAQSSSIEVTLGQLLYLGMIVEAILGICLFVLAAAGLTGVLRAQ